MKLSTTLLAAGLAKASEINAAAAQHGADLHQASHGSPQQAGDAYPGYFDNPNHVLADYK